MSGEESTVFRLNGISYLDIPARDVKVSAAFYRNVFGWELGGRPDAPSFSDGSGHVIGHWNEELAVAGKAGIIPYIYVSSVDATLEKIRENGGQVSKGPNAEGNLWIATFQDPVGNVIGIWQQGPR
jgi:uncharacterized protein